MLTRLAATVSKQEQDVHVSRLQLSCSFTHTD
jgi:hypothetical protein